MTKLSINKDRSGYKIDLERDAKSVERSLRALRKERREIENDEYLSRARRDELVEQIEADYKAEIDWFNSAYVEVMRGD